MCARFGGNLKERPHGRPRCRWEDDIKFDLKYIRWESVDWICLDQDRDKWQGFVNMTPKL
jgi:hypothetical protein